MAFTTVSTSGTSERPGCCHNQKAIITAEIAKTINNPCRLKSLRRKYKNKLLLMPMGIGLFLGLGLAIPIAIGALIRAYVIYDQHGNAINLRI